MAVTQMVNYINCKILCMILTSPKAPLPMMVKSSKSSTHILCLLSRINSVSFRSKSLIRLICSSSGTSEVANFLSNTHRLQWKQNKYWSLLIQLKLCFPIFILFTLLGYLRPISVETNSYECTTSITSHIHCSNPENWTLAVWSLFIYLFLNSLLHRHPKGFESTASTSIHSCGRRKYHLSYSSLALFFLFFIFLVNFKSL